MKSSDDDDGAFPRNWDLRQPITREQAGMEDGRGSVVYEIGSKKTREVTFQLPDNVQLDLPVYLVTFDSYGNSPSGESDPVGFDARTSRMAIDDAVDLYRSTLKQLGLDASNATRFHNEALAAQENKDTASSTDRTVSPDSDHTYGYLTFDVIAEYRPHADSAFIRLGAVWGEGTPKSRR